MRWIRAGLSTSPLACSVSYWWLTAPKYANVPLQLLQTNPHSVLWAAWYGNYFLSIEIHPLTMTVQKNMHNKRLVLEMAQQDVNIRGIPVLWAVMTVSHMLGCSSAGEKKFYMKRLVTTSVDFSQSNWFMISRGVFRIEFSLQWELRGKGHLGPLY